ncbi:MAG: PspC domain-containing protein [Chlorobi bacterium]|nr:PspC domain-containing protein [Chlorobiota bacterium]
MKKTFTVNVNGIVFHIDEDAFNVLNDYLNSIKKHFSGVDGRDEIISDIEARIAEMLQEKTNGHKQVITIEDIEKVIEVIGLPSEFDSEEVFEENPGSTSKKSKRLYRDPDNTMIAGVCGGLGSYFQSDPVWFRLVFVLAIVLGAGTGLIVYLILWIVVPEAKTTAEKLEMRGEKVNISNIEHSIKEEIDKLKDKFNDFSEEAKNTFKKKSVTHKSDLNNIANLLTQILAIFVRVVLVFAGILLTIIGFSLLLTFLVSMFGYAWYFLPFDSHISYFSLDSFTELMLGNSGSNTFLKMGLLLFIGVPFFMVLYTGIRLVLGFSKIKYTGRLAFYLWLAGLLMTSFYTYKVGKEFKRGAIYTQTETIQLPLNSPLYLSMNPDNVEYVYGDNIETTDFILTQDDDNFFLGKPHLYIDKAKSNQQKIEFEIGYMAHGKTEEKAVKRGKNIEYEYVIRDSLITFDPYFYLKKGDHWRDQRLSIHLKIPEGTYIHFDENMYVILEGRHHSPYYLSGETWLMTESGLEKRAFVPKLMEEEVVEEEM